MLLFLSSMFAERTKLILLYNLNENQSQTREKTVIYFRFDLFSMPNIIFFLTSRTQQNRTRNIVKHSRTQNPI